MANDKDLYPWQRLTLEQLKIAEGVAEGRLKVIMEGRGCGKSLWRQEIERERIAFEQEFINSTKLTMRARVRALIKDVADHLTRKDRP